MKKILKILIFLLLSFNVNAEDLGYLLNDINQNDNSILLYDKEKINFIFDIKNKNYKNIEFFISKYENIDFVVKDNNTPLFYAIDLVDLKVVKLMIEHGANLYHINNNLETALHIAVKINTVEITRYLLEQGVKISNKDSSGNTALFYAKKNANNEIIELLKYYKTIDIKEVDNLEDFIKNF
jgi:ankyrin repeat protein